MNKVLIFRKLVVVRLFPVFIASMILGTSWQSAFAKPYDAKKEINKLKKQYKAITARINSVEVKSGPVGATGATGKTGARGPAGNDGLPGAKGMDGAPGIDGAQGAEGFLKNVYPSSAPASYTLGRQSGFFTTPAANKTWPINDSGMDKNTLVILNIRLALIPETGGYRRGVHVDICQTYNDCIPATTSAEFVRQKGVNRFVGEFRGEVPPSSSQQISWNQGSITFVVPKGWYYRIYEHMPSSGSNQLDDIGNGLFTKVDTLYYDLE